MNIDKEIKIIKNEIDCINHKLDLIITMLQDDLVKSSKKLDSHIDFVENTYDSLFLPLNYIKNTINRISGYENKELISLKNK